MNGSKAGRALVWALTLAVVTPAAAQTTPAEPLSQLGYQPVSRPTPGCASVLAPKGCFGVLHPDKRIQ